MTCPFHSVPNEVTENDVSALDYDNYLQLDKILNANCPKSGENAAKWAHTEHLFITIHQVNFEVKIQVFVSFSSRPFFKTPNFFSFTLIPNKRLILHCDLASD